MKNVTVRLSDEAVETLDEEADDLDLSRAEYIRDLIEKGREADRIKADLEASRAEVERELEATQDEVERLKRELRATNARQDDVGELVEYVNEERSIQRQRQKRRQYSVLRRGWWWLTGEPNFDEEAEG